MNKFVAMLKDSYREAVDGWIFPVMLILAGIIIVLVGSASVRPLPAEVAVPRMIGSEGQGIQARQDRGQGTKPAIFFVKMEVSAVSASHSESEPWSEPLTFTVHFKKTQGPLAPAGVIIEMGEDRIPKDTASLKDLLIGGDPFKEAVRYWAGKPGEEKPKYSDDLAKEFVAALLADMGRMHGATVTQKPTKGGGLLDAAFGSSEVAFDVSVPRVERVAWAHYPRLFFGLVSLDFSGFRQPLGQLIYTLESTLLNGLGAWILLISGVIVTAGFIPNMLRKGAIDILLTKPLSRPLILFYKYLGGLCFVFLITTVAIGGVWLAIGLRTGVWAPGILLSIFGITFYFAILYACSTLVGVLTRNAIVSIVLTIVFWFLVWLIGAIYATVNVWDSINVLQSALQTQRQSEKGADKKENGQKDANGEKPPVADAPPPEPEAKIPKWVIGMFKWANRLTPRMSDLDTLTSGMIAKGLLSPSDGVRRDSRGINWAEVLAVAISWIVLLLGLATLRFVTRSY